MTGNLYWLPEKKVEIRMVLSCTVQLTHNRELSNDNGDNNENVTNLHIYLAKTIALHALHVRVSLLSISLPSSAKQQREIEKVEVL